MVPRWLLLLALALSLADVGEPKMDKAKAAGMFSSMMKKKPATAPPPPPPPGPPAATMAELFDAAIELGVNEELLDRAMEDAADPKAAIQQLLDDAQSGSGRTGDGKKVGPLGEGFKSRLPRGPVKATHKDDVGKPEAAKKGPRTPKPETVDWEPGVLPLTAENFDVSVASTRPVMVWIDTPMPPKGSAEQGAAEHREYIRALTRSFKSAAEMLEDDAKTAEKCSLATLVIDSTASKDLAMTLNVTHIPAIRLYRTGSQVEDVAQKIGGKPSAEEIFDYMKEHVTGKDKKGRVKMGEYYFDHKMFKAKMDEMGITNVKVGEDADGKIKIDTTGAEKKDEL